MKDFLVFNETSKVSSPKVDDISKYRFKSFALFLIIYLKKH